MVICVLDQGSYTQAQVDKRSQSALLPAVAFHLCTRAAAPVVIDTFFADKPVKDERRETISFS